MNELIAPVVHIASVSVVLAIGRWLGSVNSDRRTLKESVGEIRAGNREIRADIGAIRANNREIRADIGAIRANNREIRADIGAIRAGNREIRAILKGMSADITKILLRLPSRFVGNESPLRLTDLGKEVAQELNLTAWAASVAVTLESEAEGKEPYEIQDLCYAYVTDRLSEETERSVKRCAYRRGVKWKRLLDVLAVVLRDELLDRDVHRSSPCSNSKPA